MKWMAKNKLTVFLLVVITAAVVCMGVMLVSRSTKPASRVVLYDGPFGYTASEDTQIAVEDQPLFVYEVAVNHARRFTENPTTDTTPMAYFDFEGSVEIAIAVPGAVQAVVRPLSLGIRPQVKDGIVRFRLDSPAQLTIEVNGNAKRAIHLFAGSIDEDIPSPEDPDVLYFGPGVHQVGIVPLTSGQTVYVAGGAVVHGGFVGNTLEDVTIRGRGIVDGSLYDRWSQTTVAVDMRTSRNIKIEGILFLNPAGWTLNAYFCKNVEIENVKIITARANGDGITLQSCRDVVVKDSFVRSWDDSLVVKNYDLGTTRNILFDNISVWTDLAQSCEVGYETYGETMQDITFQNITVLHAYHKAVMSIHNSDQAAVSGVAFRNITVEDAQMGEGDGAGSGYLIDLTIASSQWSRSQTRGTTGDILFENITVLAGKDVPSRIMGYDDAHCVQGVDIHNLVILGRRVSTLKDGNITAVIGVRGIRIDGEEQLEGGSA